jgi:hypothetical protein
MEVARRLGGDAHGNTVSAPGPGHGPKDRSLAIKLDPNAPDGFLCFSHANDPWQRCRDCIRAKLGLPAWQPDDGQKRALPAVDVDRWDFTVVSAEAEEPLALSDDDLIRIRLARDLWDDGEDPRGTLAETYLKSRRLDLDDVVAGHVLRFHPRCPWRNENTGRNEPVPALLAAFRSIDDDTITGIHRVGLTADGRKIGRRMLGIVQRAAVKLDPLGEVLAIGEGVETCLAARQLGLKPAWALGSVGMISFFPVLDGVKRVRILGERDNASARAVRFCGVRWRRAGKRVEVIMPTVGDDLNGAIMEAS